MSELVCAGCSAPGTGPDAVRLDLDVRTTPPEHVCRKCKRKPKCARCSKRVNRTDVDGVCCACLRAQERFAKAHWRRTCACGARCDITEMNDHGECPSCSLARMRREFPLAFGDGGGARKHVLVDGTTYEQLRDYAERNGLTLDDAVDLALDDRSRKDHAS